MDLSKKTIEISESLNQPRWKEFSQIAKNIMAILIAGIPLPGTGSASTFVDKIGDHFLKPDLMEAIQKLAGLIIELAPEIEKLPKLEAQICGLLIVFEQNQALLKKMQAICDSFNQKIPQNFHVYTDNSLQELIETTVKNMNVRIEAHNNGINFLYRFKTEGGDVQFYSTGASHQRVYQSTFEGEKGGSVSMDKLNVSGPIKTFSDKKRSGIAFGPGGSLGFQKDGFLGFGKKKQEDN